MNDKLLKPPSYYALAITGILVLINIIIIAINFRKLISPGEKPYVTILVITCIGVLIGIHGILHLGLEKVYHYNPVEFLYKKVFNKKQRYYPGLW